MKKQIVMKSPAAAVRRFSGAARRAVGRRVVRLRCKNSESREPSQILKTRFQKLLGRGASYFIQK